MNLCYQITIVVCLLVCCHGTLKWNVVECKFELTKYCISSIMALIRKEKNSTKPEERSSNMLNPNITHKYDIYEFNVNSLAVIKNYTLVNYYMKVVNHSTLCIVYMF